MARRGTGDDEARNNSGEPRTDGLDLGADWLRSQLDTGAVPEQPVSDGENDADEPAPRKRGAAFRRRRPHTSAEEPTLPPLLGDTGGFEIRPANLDSGPAEHPLSLPDDDDDDDILKQLASTKPPARPEDVKTHRIELPDERPMTRSHAPEPADEPDDKPWLLSDETDDEDEQVVDAPAPRSATPSAPAPNATAPSADGLFSWNLRPNDDEDPLLSGRRREQAPQQPEQEPAHAEIPHDPTPTQAFDPFADHEPEVDPEDPRFSGVFAAPGSLDRLYDEATLSSLDGEGEGTDSDTAGEESAAGPDLGIVDVLGRRLGISDVPERPAPAPAEEPPVETEETHPEPTAGIPATLDEDVPDDADDVDVRQQLGGAPVSASAASASQAASVLPPDEEPEPRTPARQLPPPRLKPSRDIPDSRPERRRLGAANATANTPPSRRPALMIGLAVIAVLVLGGLFWVGTLIPGMISAGEAQPTPTATATPTPTLPATGPLPAGTYAWDQLRGGECLDPYTSPWEEKFTVVSCEGAHAAQLVAVGPVSDDENAAFPGQDELASQIYLLCSAPGVIDLAKAGAYTDVQVQGAYPVTEEQWKDGQRNYYCFVNRSSGDAITGSLAGGDEG
ncbi:hypothetical protein SAMN04489806_1791 [Paramicrobacterium humi]|uniref:Septum formation n=1 Tax=Paramicrobacterium humi TaxID=640635 RepID=A0A1H4M922_9MICO|nr:hypothetical protein [Microbacterium humi]SEB79443.1 hypothetical protein SAMN04489806_1791 [Microbacterium humi]